ncbi:MAG: hypothetical protein GEU90_06170 [Gemmatimonas sp.]|nr:hypothetical protein [Gemmatimonas sp.]
MFLTMLEHGGRSWVVDLKAIPETEGLGTLEFSFSNTAADGLQLRLTWRVTGKALQVLSQQGANISEDVLRRQLDRALAEARSVDANVAGP